MLVGFLIAFGLPLLLLGLLVWRAERTDPATIIAALLRNPEPREIRVSGADLVWDPSKPEPSLELEGPGLAIYTMDSRGLVHLMWKPDSGPEISRQGPIPPEVEERIRGTSVRREVSNQIIAIIALLYLFCTLIGFALGFAHGDSSDRPISSLLGAFGGFMTASMVSLVGLRFFRRHRYLHRH